MNKLSFITVLLSGVFSFMSCSKSDDDPAVEASFEVTVTGEAPNATLTLTNNSKVADTYTWTFSTGANIESSVDKTPTGITVDKAGEFTITLTASKGTDSKTATKTVTIPGKNAIKTFTGVTFAYGDNTDYGIFFSSADSKVYKKAELDATNGPKIDFALMTFKGSTMAYFVSADDADEKFGITGAKTTKILNYTSLISATEFDALVNDEKLKSLTVTNDDNTFLLSSLPKIVIFETSSGMKGAIKVTNVNATSVKADIKMMKY
jgi:hypothetical protein